MNLNQVFDLDAAAVDSIHSIERRRFAYTKLAETHGRPFVAVIGPRGVGKTVLLRQLRASRDRAVYLSADTLEVDTDLFELIRILHTQYGVADIFIDEIHFLQGCAAHLKQIYDFLPVNVWFTSSVALALDQTKWDLSRQVTVHSLMPFSFREYLLFSHRVALQELPLTRALSEPLPPEIVRAGFRFSDYLHGGLHPFLLEPGAELSLFENIVQKVVNGDIPAIQPSVSVEEIGTMKRALRIIAKSSVDGINYSTLAASLGITKYKSEQILSRLEKSFLVTRVFPSGTNVLKEPKVLLQLPYRLLYQPFDQAIGALREEFFVLAMRQHGQAFSYVKSSRGRKTPDYLLGEPLSGTVVEVGGKGKGRSQFKGVDYERKVVLVDNAAASSPEFRPGERVPLHAIGFAPA